MEVVAYTLMSNHFHFLLQTREANLSRFMQRINVAYTRYFNHRYKRVGPLMQGRYNAINERSWGSTRLREIRS